MELARLHGRRGRPPKVGLVLGAGGITGIAWLAGAACALREQTGWDPAAADLITGTSAGAVVATVIAAGHDPRGLLMHAEQPEVLADAIAHATRGRKPEGLALPLPGSVGLALKGVLGRDRSRLLASLSGLLPGGLRSTDEIRGLTYDATHEGWPEDGALWLHAWDIRKGRLVTFSRDGAPKAKLADAVAASCAVPSYYRPVTIRGRRYMDSGMRSLTNADLLAGEGCDVVIVLSPFSSNERGALLDTALFGVARSASAAQTAREVDGLRARGVQVAVVHPTAADLRAMGMNPMDRSRSRRVLETAVGSVTAQLPEALDGIALPLPERSGMSAMAAA